MGSLYGFEVDSDLPLRRLNRARGERGVVEVRHADERLEEGQGTLTGYLEDEAGEPAVALAETSDGCLLWCRRAGTFWLDARDRRITFSSVLDDEVEHRLVATALCTLLSMQGDLALHACAVDAGGDAILFCGPSGRGKSTLARALGRLGYPVLAEDGGVIDLSNPAAILYPGARGVRIRGQRNGAVQVSLTEDPGPREPNPCPVRAIALLDERGAKLSVEPLPAAPALALLTPHLVHTGSKSSVARSFGRLGRFLHDVPAFRVSLPDGLDALARAAEDAVDLILRSR